MVDIENKTDFLFVKRDFWSGLSSIVDIGATRKKFNTSKSAEAADLKAIKSDWDMIGNDIRKSMSNILSF